MECCEVQLKLNAAQIAARATAYADSHKLFFIKLQEASVQSNWPVVGSPPAVRLLAGLIGFISPDRKRFDAQTSALKSLRISSPRADKQRPISTSTLSSCARVGRAGIRLIAGLSSLLSSTFRRS
jgi:hypothetical protein